MALPKLNDVPRYDIVVPSTGQATKFRPFLVKEEKILLMALESQDQQQILNATVDLIEACVEDIESVDRLTIYDIEYLFLQVRSKSVGETSTIVLPCQDQDCDTDNEVVVNVSEVTVTNHNPKDNMIELTDQITVEMRHVSHKTVAQSNELINPSSYAEMIYSMVVKSLVAVHTEEERIGVEDEPEEQIIEFIDSLTTEQFNKMRSFVENMPTLTQEIDFKCEKCGNDNKYILRGLKDFFE